MTVPAALAGTPLLCLAGPTASGKTAVAVALSLQAPIEVLSADSRQVYRGLDIGAATPSAAERAAVVHHLLDLADPDDVMNAGRFARAAWEAELAVRARGRVPLYVGGAGLYVRAASGALAAELPQDATVRARLVAEAEREGLASLHARLAACDPETASRLAPRDQVRIVRALEIHDLAGEPASTLQRRARDAHPPRPLRVVYLERALPDLERRIRARAAAMLAGGLREECAAVLARWPGARPLLEKTVGYASLLDPALDGADETTLLDAIVRATRQYARRQRIWFQAQPGVTRLPVEAGETPQELATRARAVWGEALVPG